MQTPDTSFLQARIASIGTALFFSENKYMLPFPAYIITALKTDEEGYIWFFISRNWNKTVTYDLPFRTNLEFYRKGYPFSLKIEGDASLVNDKEIMQGFMQNLLGKSVPVKEDAISGVLLVKVKIEKATYKELVARKPYKPFYNVLSAIKNVWYPSPVQLLPSI
jgi:hypothetical protein